MPHRVVVYSYSDDEGKTKTMQELMAIASDPGNIMRVSLGG